MKIDHLSTTLGVENDVESHCYVKYIIVPANFANVIMPCQDVTHKMASSTICTRQLFISGIS